MYSTRHFHFLALSRFLWLVSLSGFYGLGSGFVQAEEKKESPAELSHELDSEHSYVGGVKMKVGAISIGHINEQASGLRYVLSRSVSDHVLLRLGAGWRRFSFGLPAAAPLPNTLQSANAVVGGDLELSDEWLMRMEIEPGIYSDFKDISSDDVNAPLTLGFSYLVNEDLQWVFGASVDARRNIPFLPGAGVRWNFADRWTLMLIPPRPRIEFELADTLKLYGGADILTGTYQVARDFGNNHGRPNLNNTSLDYTEIRLGAGASWKTKPGFVVEVDGGYMVYQEFDFHTADTKIESDGGAPYGQIALRAAF